ncbi:MAG: drug resistance transporter, EmrB/QacA subfamily [Thermoleophilia bacterium]|jgi:EmrB/QacA subfamily drug resistance transporter|nr:drug resistance transporter, EmrB/QacA subfamily [Thermoleophilia bacterium]
MTTDSTVTPLADPADVGHVPPLHGFSRWWILAIVCLAQFMVVLDATIVNVAMPRIQDGLDLSQSDLQWVINSYTLVFGGFLLLGGRAADLLGRKRLFLAGIIVFTVASLVNGLATSGEMLIIARGFQGLGGALVSPAALSIIMNSFKEGPDRTKALGVWGAIAAGGSAFGLLLGGVLTEQFSWPWIFFVNVPIGIATVLAAMRIVPESRGDVEHRSFDLGGAFTVTAGLISLVYAIVQASEPDRGFTDPRAIGFFVAAVVLLTAFIIIELRHKAPLVRLDIFRMRSLAIANVTMLFVLAGMFGLFFFSSLYVQRVLGYEPLQAGLAFLPVTVAIGIASALAIYLLPRIGVKSVTTIGLLLTAVGLLLWTQMEVDSTYLANVLPAIIVFALGMGMVFVPATLVATTGVSDADAGLASGIFNTSQQIGGALGLAVLSTVAVRTTKTELEGLGHQPSEREALVAMVDGFDRAYYVAAAFVVIALIVFVTGIRKQDVERIESGEVALTPGV